MVAVAGVTAMDARVAAGAVTARFALPLTPLRVAVTVAEPEARAVARPAALIFATAAFDVVQATVVVTFAVELSL
jgi:hypothetical protein